MNLTGQAVYQKGQKRKREHRKSIAPHLIDLLEGAKAKGSDRDFLDWLKTQPSAYSGLKDYDRDTGISYCDPCHYRTAANSGTATKPDYCAVPLTHAEHQRQHAVGTFAFMPREWWEEQVRVHLERWIASGRPNG